MTAPAVTAPTALAAAPAGGDLVQAVDWAAIAPPTIAAVVALAVLVADLFLPPARKPLLAWTAMAGLAAALLALAPGGAAAARSKPPKAQRGGRRGPRGPRAPRRGPRSRAPRSRAPGGRGGSGRARALRSARYSLEVSARVDVDWVEKTSGEMGCHRIEIDFTGYERWSVKTRRPALVTISELAPGGDLKLVYDEAEGGAAGVEVGGSWERRASGKWRNHPITGTPSCAGAVYSEGLPEQRGCGTLLPQQYADLRLNVQRAHMAFSDASNLPDKRPHGICRHWSPTDFGDMPEWLGDRATTGISRRALLTTKVGRTIALRGRHHKPNGSTPFPPTSGVDARGTYTWEARLTRVRDVRAR